jgi:hypothetical protein
VREDLNHDGGELWQLLLHGITQRDGKKQNKSGGMSERGREEENGGGTRRKCA